MSIFYGGERYPYSHVRGTGTVLVGDCASIAYQFLSLKIVPRLIDAAASGKQQALKYADVAVDSCMRKIENARRRVRGSIRTNKSDRIQVGPHKRMDRNILRFLDRNESIARRASQNLIDLYNTIYLQQKLIAEDKKKKATTPKLKQIYNFRLRMLGLCIRFIKRLFNNCFVSEALLKG